jgi:hypothetical protein
MKWTIAALVCSFAAWGDHSATRLGDVLGANVSAVALDPGGNIIAAGSTTSFQFPVTNGTSNPSTNFIVSDDHGATWRTLSNLPAGTAFTFAAAPSSPQVVYASGLSGAFRSADGGASWTAVSPVPFQAARLTVDPARADVLYGSNSTGIYRSSDAGLTWSNIAAFVAPYQMTPLYLVIDPFHTDTLYTHVVFQDYRSFDGGKTWSTYTLPGVGNDGTSAGAVAFDPLRPGVIYATGGQGIFRSGDGGQNWSRLNTPFTYGGPVTVSAAAPGVIWVRDQLGVLYRSSDQGQSFTALLAAPRNEFQLVVDPSNASILLTEGHRSTDGGATWQPLTLARTGTIAFDGTASGRAIAMANAGGDGFVAKLDPSGEKILFATYLGGFNGASISAIATDSAGSFYVTGATFSSDFPVTAGAALSTPPAAGNNSFAAKFDSSGNLVYATYLPADTPAFALAIGVDRQGSASVAGIGFTGVNPTRCFFTRLSPDGGSVLVQTAFEHIACSAVAFDAAGNGVAVGSSPDGAFLATSDAVQPAPKSAHNAVVVKFDSAGQVRYATWIGGSAIENANAVAVDSDGNIYVAGITKSKDFPATDGAYQTRFTADCPYATGLNPTGFIGGIPVIDNQNGFLTKLDASGALVFSTYLGGNCNDTIYAVAVDAGGDAWIAGVTDSSTFPLVWPLEEYNISPYRGFATRVAGSGTWLWRSTFLSGIPSKALALDAAGNAYLGVSNGVLIKVGGQP